MVTSSVILPGIISGLTRKLQSIIYQMQQAENRELLD